MCFEHLRCMGIFVGSVCAIQKVSIAVDCDTSSTCTAEQDENDGGKTRRARGTHCPLRGGGGGGGGGGRGKGGSRDKGEGGGIGEGGEVGIDDSMWVGHGMVV